MTQLDSTHTAGPRALAQRDLRGTTLWKEIETFYRRSYEGLFGRISAVADAALSPGGSAIAFTGSGLNSLASGPWRRVHVRSGDGELRPVGHPDHDSFRPRWSTSGRWLAFLEKATHGRQASRLVFLDVSDGSLTVADVGADLGVEDYVWDPISERVLVWTKEAAALLPTVPRAAGADWMPVARSTEVPIQQQIGVASPDGATEILPPLSIWLWEAAWIGENSVAAIASSLGEPADWYRAELGVLHLAGEFEPRYQPARQIGRLAVSPRFERMSIVEGTASDRGMVAGRLVIVQTGTGERWEPRSNGTDVTYAEWTDETSLTYFGLRRQRSVIGSLDARSGGWTETWSSAGSFGMPMPVGQALAPGAALIAYEDWHTPRQLRTVGNPSLDTPGLDIDCSGVGTGWQIKHKGVISEVAWTTDDGMELEGLLITPHSSGEPPYPLVLNIHGGPVWAWRNTWEIVGHTPIALLVSRGFAVLNPNCRGSVGWGPELTDGILGEMGGKDLGDYLSAVRHLIEAGIADARRLSVIGHSYGGLTTCNLVTHTSLFSAAVAISPVSGWLSQHHLSAIPGFDELFVGDVGRGREPQGPIVAADEARTPTLLIGCEQDECTPANQAIEFYRALARAGRTPTGLALYPSEGHGIERWPALMDQSVRIVDWLERYAR